MYIKRLLPAILLAFILLPGTTASAQEQQEAPPFRKRTYLKVNPTTIINELDLYLEQDLSEKISLEVGLTGIYTDYPDFVFFKRVDVGQRKPGISTEQFVEGRGLGLRVGMKWYLIRNASAFNAKGTYFQPVVFYKKIFYPNEDVTLNGNTYENSGDKNVFGLQFLLGRQIKKDKYILDPYIGIGVRGKMYNYTNNTIENNTVVSKSDDLLNILPSLHLGIKIGLAL